MSRPRSTYAASMHLFFIFIFIFIMINHIITHLFFTHFSEYILSFLNDNGDEECE